MTPDQLIKNSIASTFIKHLGCLPFCCWWMFRRCWCIWNIWGLEERWTALNWKQRLIHHSSLRLKSSAFGPLQLMPRSELSQVKPTTISIYTQTNGTDTHYYIVQGKWIKKTAARTEKYCLFLLCFWPNEKFCRIYIGDTHNATNYNFS